MEYVGETLSNLLHQTAFFNLTVGNYVMILVACFFLFLAIKKGFEPLLLVPIAFGMLLVNIYPDIISYGNGVELENLIDLKIETDFEGGKVFKTVLAKTFAAHKSAQRYKKLLKNANIFN